MDVGKDTTLCNGDVSEKLVQFLIVADGELEMTGNDTGLLVVTGSIAGQFKDFCCEVLKDGGKVDRGTYWRGLDICNAHLALEDGTYRHRRAERSYLSSTDGGHDQRGMRDQPWMNG